MVNQPLDGLPIWAIYPLTVIVLFAALAGGYYFAKGRGARGSAKSDLRSRRHLGCDIGPVGLPSGLRGRLRRERMARAKSAGRFGSQCHQHHVSSGRISRRALPNGITRVTDRLHESARGRFDPDNLAAAKARSEEIHKELWLLAEDLVRDGNTAATFGLYVSSLNQVIDLHTERVNVGLYVRIPPLILVVMLVLSPCSPCSW